MDVVVETSKDAHIEPRTDMDLNDWPLFFHSFMPLQPATHFSQDIIIASKKSVIAVFCEETQLNSTDRSVCG
jgi:hypothetical protein